MLKFRNGTNTIVYGMTSSGKTTFMFDVLKKKLITNFPDKIFYLYRIHQKKFSDWNEVLTNPKIDFVEGLQLNLVKDYGGNCVVIIDDLALENQRRTAELFLFESHHLNITTFFMTQNLYMKDDCFRTMSLNAAYFVLFANIRSLRQIKTLANQIFSGRDVDRVMEAYKKARDTPFGFIVLNLVQNFPKELVVCTNFFDESPSFFL